MGKLQSLWFRHDFNASSDEKIVRLLMKKGVSGYGVYWLLIEELAKANNLELACSYDELAYKLHTKESLVKSIVEDFELFVVNDGKFYTQRLRSDMEEMTRSKEKRSNAGKKGGGNPNFKKGQPNPYYTKEINNVYAEDKQEINNVYAEDKQIRIRRDNIETRQDEYKIENTPIPPKKADGVCGDNSAFVPPTAEEVKAYCTERGNDIDPEEFVAFYESKGWRVGNAQMKSWKGAIIGWEKRREKKKKEQAASNGIRLGCEEWIDENGRRTYGTGKFTVPNDAPPRPSVKHVWVNSDRQWTIL